ncbi:MAG TPA: hypothetical protein VK508_12320 [Cyclobacteriaceae bacterium]|nr:hypothetical protein [Cyclobacteriaceae bacterium]
MKWAVLLAMVVSLTASGQVANNNIENRLKLGLNKPLQSSTDGADVQWKCVNKALTNKCLVHHNDQWFTFSVDKDGDYYINIASQTCRDSKGIQMIVIEGNPCQTSTYRIMECISQIRLEDVFVVLPKLKASVPYLINVDGFLGDHCGFEIELADKPKGLPRDPVILDTLEIDSRLENKVVSMKWTVHGEIAKDLSVFRIFRQKGRGTLELAEEIGVGRNAIGTASNNYRFADTLRTAGAYKYEIYGIRESDNMPMLLSQSRFNFYQKPVVTEEKPVTKALAVRLKFSEKEQFTLRLYNYDGDKLLWTHSGESQGAGELFMIDPQPYVQYGLRKFQLLVLDSDGKTVEEIYFRVDSNNSIIRE